MPDDNPQPTSGSDGGAGPASAPADPPYQPPPAEYENRGGIETKRHR